MDPSALDVPPSSHRIPRARGDGPWRWNGISRMARDSPRSRGWTVAKDLSIDRNDGFPALAGMDPLLQLKSIFCFWIPRARGDGPLTICRSGRSTTDSPRSRGWTRAGGRARRADRGFPALAGMDRQSAVAEQPLDRIPRARGDGPRAYRERDEAEGDSPRSRGWTARRRRRRTPAPGFPALAGMDPSRGRGGEA